MTGKQRRRATIAAKVRGRDRRCRGCGFFPPGDLGAFGRVTQLDVHHITPRGVMPGGGYVAENLIGLCPQCHIHAEDFLKGTPDRDRAPGVDYLKFAPSALYRLIGSSYQLALAAAQAAA